MFRSGSTLVEQILAGHPRIAAGGEIDFLPAFVATELAPFPASSPGMQQEQMRTSMRDICNSLPDCIPVRKSSSTSAPTISSTSA